MELHANKTNLKKLAFLGFSNGEKYPQDGLNDGNDEEVHLDDECAKVFTMDTDSLHRFNVDKFYDTALSSEPKQYGEKEYSMHRKQSYPHVHVPLRATRSMKRRIIPPIIAQNITSRNNLDENVSSPASSAKVSSLSTNTSSSLGSPIFHITESDSTLHFSTANFPEDDLYITSSESECVLSDPSGYRSPPDSSPDKKVQFAKEKEILENSNEDFKNKKLKSFKRSHHYGYSKPRKFSTTDKNGLDQNKTRRISIQPEDLPLRGTDRDQLESHRSDDAKGLRRHKAYRPSLVHIGRKDLTNFKSRLMKKMYDHSPHAIFVQLDELYNLNGEREWKETARWIKYEEDVEEGLDRWGKPHVASLSFHSLLNLRKCLEEGLVKLDFEENDLPGIAYRICEEMYKEDLIRAEDKAALMKILLLRHHHVNEHHDRGFRFNRKHSYASLQSQWLEDAVLNYNTPRFSVCSAQAVICPTHRASISSFSHNLHDSEKRKTSFSLDAAHLMKTNSSKVNSDGRLIPSNNNCAIDIKEETYTSSEEIKKSQNDTILKRIPKGAQGTSVLVGDVDFLEQPAIAFIRLAEGVVIPSLIEVNIPVRFIFILLGPKGANLDYHEVGRSISTLMANHQFHNIAYEAYNRKALLSAINEFLDDSIVLPPGDWERQALLSIEEIKAKSEAIKKRKENALRKNIAGDPKLLLLGDGKDDKKPPLESPLDRTGRPFGGLVNDLKRRFPFYKSDFTQGISTQTIAAAIFMYFAALSGAITFGGLLSNKTNNYIGISETLIATSFSGIIFALLGAQPLVIIGATGPLLLFDESLFQFCETNDIDYLTIRLYIGIWLGVIALIVALFEGSVFVKLFTRFTEEIFSSLISLLYIVESVMKLFTVYGRHPLLKNYYYTDSIVFSIISNKSIMNYTNVHTNFTGLQLHPRELEVFLPSHDEIGPINQPNTALFCTILSLGTFAIAYYLLLFRNSQFLGRSARRALGDFGVPIAIIIMVTLDYLVPDTYTEKLSVPEGLSPSNSQIRGWIINPRGVNETFPIWLSFVAVVPAMLVYILLFMETHICELIIDKPERKLKRGSGFHVDIVIVCILNVFCGLIGAPWMCVATVRSVAHVSALTVMSRTHAPGEKPHLIEVKEQRVSALLVSMMVGLSVLMSPLLRLVPMPVLFGVFLYMGVASTNGIQFFDRIKLFFMPAKHHPHASYVRKVRTLKMHLFTTIQLMCLVILWIIKSTQASLAFPFFLLLMVPLRANLKYLFTPIELRALDGNEPDIEEDEPDFYAEAPLPG